MKKTHKNLICLLLAFCMALVLVPCAAADSEWTREGYFADENAYMISVTWMELDDESGWYVACMLGEDLIEDSYGGMLPQEGDALHGALLSDAGKEALTVTVSEAEEGGLRLEIEGGETYLFSPIELETADYGINIYTDGMGYIDYAETEDELSFDEPLTYAGFGFSEPCTCVLGAKADEDGWVFAKWTKDGEDYSTDPIITVELTEDVEYVAVFEWLPEPEAAESNGEPADIDYLVLVNKVNPLPEGWEDALETVTITNSVGDEVEVEAKAYAAYELLKADLAVNDCVYLELDSARRSVAEQQDIMDRFIEKYGADYAAKTVAKPGYSEHHTGLALDLYFNIQGDNGEFHDVYYNEDMEKEEYRDVWDSIHAKLADYGFILRYLEGEEHITGYRYEPWHIRYVDDPDIAREIMSQPGLTLEEYLAGQSAPEVAIDLSGSELCTEEELYDAMLAIKCEFASWEGCELHAIRYAGDEANNEENLEWLNSLSEEGRFTQAAEFLIDFHSPVEEGPYAWEPDTEYIDYQWWLARTEDGDWEIVSWGY